MTVKAIDGLKSDDDSWNFIKWKEVNQTVDCLQMRIVKSVRNNYWRVLDCALTMLEPCEVKVSRRVLRGGWDRKVPSLPDISQTAAKPVNSTFGMK